MSPPLFFPHLLRLASAAASDSLPSAYLAPAAELSVRERANDVCGFIDDQPADERCSLGAVLALAALESAAATRSCARQAPPDWPLTPLTDARPLPPAFTGASSLYSDEGAAYAWAAEMLASLDAWRACRAADPFVELALPRGFALVAELPPTRAPAGAVFLNAATRQAALLLASDGGALEWGTAGQAGAAEAIAAELGAPVHVGLAAAFDAAWGDAFAAAWQGAPGGAREALLALAERGAADAVLVAGHGFGGGVAALAALAAHDLLAAAAAPRPAPRVDALLFAAPAAGPPAFANAFDTKVNGRRIAFAGDLAPQLPCAPEAPACADGGGADPGPLVPYQPVGGAILLVAADMPADARAWAEDLPRAGEPEYSAAAHGCAHRCWASSFMPGREGAACWLGAAPAGARGSACPGFAA
jgi:hypothetical protein